MHDNTANDDSTVSIPAARNDGTIRENLTDNAYENVFPARYLKRNEEGEIVETVEEAFERVSHNVALADLAHQTEDSIEGRVHVSADCVRPDDPEEKRRKIFGIIFAEYGGGHGPRDSEIPVNEDTAKYLDYESVRRELTGEVKSELEDTADKFFDHISSLKFTPNCIPSGSLVASDGGLNEIQDVESGDRVYDDVDGNATVESKFDNGSKEVVRIKTRSGYAVRATPEHYFRVITDDGNYDWKQVKDISDGDVMALQEDFLDDDVTDPNLDSLGDGESPYDVGSPRHGFSSPSLMTPDLAEWLGLYVANGATRESGVRVAFNGGDDDLHSHWVELTAELFDFQPTLNDHHSDADCVEGGAYRRDLVDYLDTNGLRKESSNDAVIPSPVMGGGKSVSAAFIRGLFEADGTIDDQCIEYYSNSYELAHGVQKLLLGLGIRGVLKEKRGGYRLTIRKNRSGKRFVEQIGFISERKRSKQHEYTEVDERSTTIKIPNMVKPMRKWLSNNDISSEVRSDIRQFVLPPDSDYLQQFSYRSFERTAAEHPVLLESPVAEFAERDQLYEQVVSIEGMGTMPVEDMKIPRRNTYVTEGFVSHNSPTWMNAGNTLQQLSACFVSNPEDDLTDIFDTEGDAAKVFQSGGGLGYDFSSLRPYGDPVGGSGGVASGPISFMRSYDTMCATIAQGGKRRGAQMANMRIDHPDAPYFIHSKRMDVSLAQTLLLNDPDDFTHSSFGDALEEARELIDDEGRVPEHLRNAAEGHLSNFNISLFIPDRFMDALENEDTYEMINPRTGEQHIATDGTVEMYGWFDLDEYVEVGEPVELPAEEIWSRIITGAHANGEPGVIFDDTVNRDHSFDVDKYPEKRIKATNPCGEQALMDYESCTLGHINLSTITQADGDGNTITFERWTESRGRYYHGGPSPQDIREYLMDAINHEELQSRVDMGVHYLDNVLTMSDFPIEKIDQMAKDNRKIGLGIMGLAQLYVELGVEYGSDIGNEIARQLMSTINHFSKRKSNELAKERGVFPNWEDSKWADPESHTEWFEKHTGLVASEFSDGFRMRNHNTMTIAPTGTTSMVGNTTGGCEPMFNVANYKNVSQDVQGEEMLVQFDSLFLDVLEASGIDVDEVKTECQELMEAGEFDTARDLDTVPDELARLFVTSGELTAKEHASVQCACQEGVDSSISKTTNASHDSTVEDADEVFRYIYENGGKGITYYRDGSRSKQVLTTRKENSLDGFAEESGEFNAESLVESLDEEQLADLENEMQIDNEAPDYDEPDVIIGTEDSSDEDGYATKRPRPDVLHGASQRIDTGFGKIYVNVNDDENGRPFEVFLNTGKSGGFTNGFTEALAQMISVALRSGVDPEEVIDGISGIKSPRVAWDQGEQIESIPDGVATGLRRHIDRDLSGVREGAQSLAEDSEFETDGGSDDDENSESEDTGGMRSHAGAAADMIANGESPECPECGAFALSYSEGCKKCESCGWSECG